MDDDNEYYDWDNIPCVLIKGTTSDKPVYMPGESKSWVNADMMIYLEWRFKAKAKLSRTEFERYFGVIGKDLPSLPEHD